MVVLGLLILILSVVVGVGVILMPDNNDAADTLTVFGFHVDLSQAGVFIFGAAVGALALLGLALMLSALRRSSHRRKAAELDHYRHDAESARQERDELLEARERQLEQERELHARHERELREVRETSTTPEALEDAPRARDTREPRLDEPTTVTSSRRESVEDTRRAVPESRQPAVHTDDSGHKEGLWHRLTHSPAHRS
ncbi:hypothetical protein [Smaragdicoccus niigatensis]|uniref:hypothetical protein n=1 Tax=Smaragdicoccus niigatensis TaxID=359359 RepID=UPI00037338E9|nr:hypothetical protein [Smaragdicoccus niigatensis]